MVDISKIQESKYKIDGELLLAIIEALSEVPFNKVASVLDKISNLQEEPKIHLAKEKNFNDLERKIEEFNPSLVGFTIYTGNHREVFEYSDSLRKRKKIETIFGGPHATYFPKESSNYTDYVVLSQGFHSFREILNGKASKGILHLQKKENFPLSLRNQFYNEHLEHKKSEIKSIITQQLAIITDMGDLLRVCLR